MPLERDLTLWLTFDAGARSAVNSSSAKYPLTSSPPMNPSFVLDRSGNNFTARVIGNITFGTDDGSGGMSVASMCHQGALSVPGLVGLRWHTGFTTTVYFRRTRGDRYQSVIGNGFSPQASFEFRLAPSDGRDWDDMHCYTSFEGGSGNKAFAASAAKGQWHFAALSYNPNTLMVTAYFDGRLATSECTLVVFVTSCEWLCLNMRCVRRQAGALAAFHSGTRRCSLVRALMVCWMRSAARYTTSVCTTAR
jgi:hypothetical protein